MIQDYIQTKTMSDLVSKAVSMLNSRAFSPLTDGLKLLNNKPEIISHGWQMVESSKPKPKMLMDAPCPDSPTREFEYIRITLENLSDDFEEVKFDLFSLDQPPRNWYRTMLLGQPLSTMDACIAESISDIHKEHGVHGVLQVIFWANTYKLQSGATSFWRKVENSAHALLSGQQEYLVVVSGYLVELQKALGGNPNFCDGTPFIVEGECFFIFRSGRGLGLIGYAKGLSMLGVQDLDTQRY